MSGNEEACCPGKMSEQGILESSGGRGEPCRHDSPSFPFLLGAYPFPHPRQLSLGSIRCRTVSCEEKSVDAEDNVNEM